MQIFVISTCKMAIGLHIKEQRPLYHLHSQETPHSPIPWQQLWPCVSNVHHKMKGTYSDIDIILPVNVTHAIFWNGDNPPWQQDLSPRLLPQINESCWTTFTNILSRTKVNCSTEINVNTFRILVRKIVEKQNNCFDILTIIVTQF